MDPSQWPDWLVYTLTGVCIVAFLGIVYWRLSPVLFFKKRATQVPGVIANWMRVREKGQPYFYPLIRYKDLHGQAHEYRADERCEGHPMYPVGTPVTVFYNPNNPKQVQTEYPDKTGQHSA